METSHFLDMIESPRDLKVLNSNQLRLLANEIRQKIINTVSKTGGHLAPSLGVVELTIALHRVFNCPEDKIVWDVGHQSYAHKLLTGRAKRFHTLRQYKGISGFPRICESKYDSFGTGHSSTSISAALGIAKARDIKNERFKVISVIGDGALTGGMAFEGLNQAGHLKTNLIVVLNDNKMSISPNVGALSSYLRKMITHPKYRQTRKKVERLLKIWSKKAAAKAFALEDTIRALSGPGLLFKEMGFRYYGPVHGHDIDSLIRAFDNIKDVSGPVLVHVITKKGKGYAFAEEEVTKFHGISKFNVANGQKVDAGGNITYTNAFSNALVKLARQDPKIIAVTAAMASGTGLDAFSKEFPERFFDVGIAEQHAVTFSAGLATQGFKPVVAIYSTFLQRAYDQIMHDVCLQGLPVIFAVDRAGLVGEDGATHQGCFDISYLRSIPNMVIMSPKDEDEIGHMLKTAVQLEKPVAIRYPRGAGQGIIVHNPYQVLEFGKAEVLREGDDVLILCAGPLCYDALKAADENRRVSCCVVNSRFLKPLDEELIVSLARRIGKVITIEENSIEGGFGSSVLELFEKNKVKADVKRIGIPDRFIEHGSQEELKREVGLTKKEIEKVIREFT
ncbi:MAG TPA: 1-deoxy-D-xylulose-5-phosphate synthase [Candidatus Nanoarchaeia archaeon]|nr:1-deoxy-D-xylulose-5-phosphate synthase [Candidatus Nanoarchaeia archaeon]